MSLARMDKCKFYSDPKHLNVNFTPTPNILNFTPTPNIYRYFPNAKNAYDLIAAIKPAHDVLK